MQNLLCAAIWHNVKELELYICMTATKSVGVILPPEVFTSRSLVVLKIRGSIELDIPELVCLPILKVLLLEYIELEDNDSMRRLFKGCKMLQHLLIYRCRARRVDVVDLSIPSLTNLTIDGLYKATKFIIDTPNLELFEYKGPEFQLVNELESLYRAKISITSVKDHESVYTSINKMHGVKSLYLSQALHSSCDSLPVFEYLTHLELYFDNLQALSKMLETTPQRRELVLLSLEKSEEAEKGTFVPNRHRDILSAALGKEDHPGRPRTFGGYVGGVRVVFGKPSVFEKPSKQSKKRASDRYDIDRLVEQVVQSRLNAYFDNRVQHYIKNRVQQEVVDTLIQLGFQVPVEMRTTMQLPDGFRTKVPVHLQTSSSCDSNNLDPFDGLQKPTKCTLAVWIGTNGEKQMVARGNVWPSEPGTKVHNQDLLEGHVKVTIDEGLPGMGMYPLPVPFQHHNIVGTVQGSFAQWPKDLVLLGEEVTQEKAKNNDKGKQKCEQC